MNAADSYGHIQRIPEQRCFFEARNAIGAKTRGFKVVHGTVVGAITNAYWHPYMYAAYHIVTDDGERVTVLAKYVRIPGTISRSGEIQCFPK